MLNREKFPNDIQLKSNNQKAISQRKLQKRYYIIIPGSKISHLKSTGTLCLGLEETIHQKWEIVRLPYLQGNP